VGTTLAPLNIGPEVLYVIDVLKVCSIYCSAILRKMEIYSIVAVQTTLFVCDLCNDAVSSSDYIVLNYRMINE
jgi:hypothetical protein